jgi:O-methyltransferase
MKQIIQSIFNAFGYTLQRQQPRNHTEVRLWPEDCSPDDIRILQAVSAFTMTGTSNQITLINAVRHLCRARIPGCMVECGVWRGGSSMAITMALAQEGEINRDIYLFDTFEGMSPPTEQDRRVDGALAANLLNADPNRSGLVWAFAGLQEVQANVLSTGYPQDKIHFIKGPVEATLPEESPKEPIALLRLDTDWYESTKCEMEHLFPRVSTGGIIIIDDYGHWHGAKRAVDEYLEQITKPYFLHRIDETARLLVKL